MSTDLQPSTTPPASVSLIREDGAKGVAHIEDESTQQERTQTREVTVVVPTRNESGNIVELLRRLDESLSGLSAEVVFVDDSDDSTPEQIAGEQGQHAYPVRLLHRGGTDRTGGLGSAVLAGLTAASAPWVVVMDGDLQHPPEVVPLLVAAGRGAGADLVVATRYLGTGSASGLDGRLRAIVSRTCTAVTRIAFPSRLAGVTDPMSGFFAVRPAALQLDALRPTGYKILLEIVARSPVLRSSEVAFSFQPRFSGQSKASVREGLTFLRRLAALRLVAWVLDSRTGPAHLLRLARLVFPLLVTLAAFPNLVWLIRNPGSHRGLAGSLICVIAALVAATGRLRPRTGEPDVHDRQVDMILAIPVLGLAAWLKLGWTSSIGLHTGLTDHEVVAAVACLCGIYLVTLGTRTTARLGLPFVLLLTASPSLATHRAVPVAVGAAAVVAVVSRVRQRRQALAAGPVNGGGESSTSRPRFRADRWPALRVASAAVALVAVLLVADDGRLALRTPPLVNRADSLTASGKVAPVVGGRARPSAAATSPSTTGDRTPGGRVSPSPAPAAPQPTPLLGPVIIPRLLDPTPAATPADTGATTSNEGAE